MSIGLAPAVPLKDVEWRLDSEPKDGDRGMRARFVPHINARTAAALMDEWVGPCGWSQSDAVVTIAGKEAVQCTVSVFDGEQWVSKQDVGVASNTEPQKGAVSDAFKRVVTVKWGAGRNVYELPTLWAPCKAVNGRDGKVRGYATDATLPDILRQLKAKGFDADGCRLEDGASDENAADGSAPPASVAAGTVDSSQTVPATSKLRRENIKARCVALQGDNVSVAEKRAEWQLPTVDKSDDKQLGLWEELLSDLEKSLTAPFEKATA